MNVKAQGFVLLAVLACLPLGGLSRAHAGELTVELGRSEGVTFLGAFRRWDADGNPRAPVNAKAKIDVPEVAAKAERLAGNRWVFRNLPSGRYDLVILAGERVRVEGFDYPPVAEFDPFLPSNATAPEDVRNWVIQDIAKSQYYENKVKPLYLAGNEKQVRVFIQLVRDKPTSYDRDYGAPVATVRHEVWQYTNQYGGWVKDKRTKVLDRILMAKSEFQRWTWVWEPGLGGIEVADKPVKVSYELPDRFDPETAKGWLPD